jgi:hypothetical protein
MGGGIIFMLLLRLSITNFTSTSTLNFVRKCICKKSSNSNKQNQKNSFHPQRMCKHANGDIPA